MLSSYADISLF